MIQVVLSITLLLPACGLSEQRRPVGSSVEVQVINGLELAWTDVRYALIYTLEDGFYVAADAPLPTLDGSFVLDLDIPPPEVLAAVSPVESMRVREAFPVDVFRPRLVAYLDGGTTAPGRFDAPVLGLEGDDRVIGIESTASAAIAFVFNLQKVLKELRLEEVESYYYSTRNRFTPFVRAAEEVSLWIAYDAVSAPVILPLTDSPVPQERLSCRRDRVWVFGGFGPANRVRAHVGVGLDPDVICGLAIPDCTAEDLADLAAPELEFGESDAVLGVVQCRATLGIEVLIRHQATRSCEDCVCVRQGTAEVYFSDPANPPAWWPCGDTIDYCDSTLPLYQMDPDCIVEEEEEEE